MKISTILRGASLVALTILSIGLMTIFPTRLGGQEVNLLPKPDPDARALYEAASALRTSGDDFLDPLKINELSSPDASKLQMLNETASSEADSLRAVADLLTVYINLECEADRAMMKPLLRDRVRLHSRLLGLDAEKAAIPLGMANLATTTKRALKLRDDLIAAKNRLDTVTATLR